MFYDQCKELLQHLRIAPVRSPDQAAGFREEGSESFPEHQLFYIREDSWDFLDMSEYVKQMKQLVNSSISGKKVEIRVPCHGLLPYKHTALEFDNVLYLFFDTGPATAINKSTGNEIDGNLVLLMMIKKKNSNMLESLRRAISGKFTEDSSVEIPMSAFSLDGNVATYCGANTDLEGERRWFGMRGDLEKNIEEFHIYHSRALLVLAKFINFLSCKNVRAIDIKASERLNKSRVKKGKLPLVSYKMLQLHQVGKKQAKGSSSKDLWTNRIHLCRGHFKEFTEDKPLLGRHVGRYWWEPSVRGRNKDGIVIKDYEVQT